MGDLASHISALSVFLGIAALGFLFLLVSLVFGEIFDHVDFAHDFDHGGPGVLSPRVVSVFMTAFGGFGAIGTYLGYGVFPSSFFGLAGGVALATVIYLFARFLYSQQASSMVTTSDLVGCTAQVTVGIPMDGSGRVRCLIGESIVDKTARSKTGREIPNNAIVRIDEIVGESVIVSPANGSPPATTSSQG
jgi:membrane protein implicated in regulation of membrane protease activity